MALFESEGLVLRSYRLAEADRIVVVFTRDHGMVRGVAKGARRLKSRFGSTLEIFSTVNVTFFQKEERELVSFQQFDLVKSRFEMAADPEYLHTFSYLSDLLVSIVPPHDPNEKIYRMAGACLDAGAGTGGELLALRVYFEMWLLRLGGYLPDWAVCGQCGQTLAFNEEASLRHDSHLICASCRGVRKMPSMSSLHRNIYQAINSTPPVVFMATYKHEPQAIEELSDLMRRIVTQVVGRDLLNEKTLAVHT